MKYHQQQAGYTLFELLIVVIVITVLATTAVVNLGPMMVSLDIEAVTNQVLTNMVSARRSALSGNPNIITRQFDINKALNGKHPGIILQTQSGSGSTINCQGNCANQQQLCLSGINYCYTPAALFEFQRFSGELSQGHAVFIISNSRKMLVLASQNGEIRAAELIDGQWRTREDIQGLNGK
jgi:prepilin-type N-terminal cleavage/methylation domain-containing protein